MSDVNQSTGEKIRIMNKVRELNVLVLKSKTKALARTKTQADAKPIVEDFKFIQDKITELLDCSEAMFQLELLPDESQSPLPTSITLPANLRSP